MNETLSLLAVAIDTEQFNTGYIERLGRSGFIASLLARLKNAISEDGK